MRIDHLLQLATTHFMHMAKIKSEGHNVSSLLADFHAFIYRRIVSLRIARSKPQLIQTMNPEGCTNFLMP